MASFKGINIHQLIDAVFIDQPKIDIPANIVSMACLKKESFLDIVKNENPARDFFISCWMETNINELNFLMKKIFYED
jgi:hypothetical protein